MNTASGFTTRAVFGWTTLLGIGAAAAGFGPDLMAPKDPTTDVPTFAVRKDDLTISVSETGTIQAREQVVLKNEVEGRTTIIFLIEEGTLVQPGDLLVQLDVSDLEDQKIEREIKVQNAEAAMIGAREDLEVVKSQATSDVSLAELDARFAKEDLDNYLEGEYPRQYKEAESKITLAMEELENASETLRWSERLFDEKYISQTELDRDRLAQSRAKLDHELAVAALELLEEYTHVRRLDELKSNIEQTQMALDRIQRKAKASIVQAEANLRAKESEHDQQKNQLDRINTQIAKARIIAPVAGMVVHATTGKGNWRGNDEPLKEGREIREREELIFLPVANSVMAKISVHETSLDKVKLGQRVRVTVDALPGRSFTGSIARIAPLPDAQSVWMNPDLKLYPTEIHLDGELGELRTGMSCRSEILVDHLEGVVHVPLQSVVRVGSQPRVYVKHGPTFEPRDVDLGLDNRHMVHIKSGLDVGDMVMMAPPLEDGARRIDSAGFTDAELAAADFTPGESSGAGGSGPGGGGPEASAGEDGGRRGRGNRGSRSGRGGGAGGPSADQMAEFRKRMESMSPEEREKMRERFSGGSGGGGDAAEGDQ